eukprot:COSAG05_NODE_3614_length_1958_cov_3.460463_1_plen_261_part_00
MIAYTQQLERQQAEDLAAQQEQEEREQEDNVEEESLGLSKGCQVLFVDPLLIFASGTAAAVIMLPLLHPSSLRRGFSQRWSYTQDSAYYPPLPMVGGLVWGGLTALCGGGVATACMSLLRCTKRLRVSGLCIVVFFAGYLSARMHDLPLSSPGQFGGGDGAGAHTPSGDLAAWPAILSSCVVVRLWTPKSTRWDRRKKMSVPAPQGEDFFLSVLAAVAGAVSGLELHHRASDGVTSWGSTYYAGCSRLLAAVPYLFLEET